MHLAKRKKEAYCRVGLVESELKTSNKRVCNLATTCVLLQLALLLVPFSQAFSSVGQALEARKAYTKRHNCSLDEVFFEVNDTDGNAREGCGQCLPGSTGVWQIIGVPPDFNLRVRYCPPPLPMLSTPCEARDPWHQPAAFFCGINEYCTDQGVCKALKKSPMYNKACRGFDKECGPGLDCIFHRCVICEEGVTVDYSMQSPGGIKRNQAYKVVRSQCLEGEYVTINYWKTFINRPRSSWCFIIFLSCSFLAAAFLLCTLGKEIYHRGKYSNRLRSAICSDRALEHEPEDVELEEIETDVEEFSRSEDSSTLHTEG